MRIWLTTRIVYQTRCWLMNASEHFVCWHDSRGVATLSKCTCKYGHHGDQQNFPHISLLVLRVEVHGFVEEGSHSICYLLREYHPRIYFCPRSTCHPGREVVFGFGGSVVLMCDMVLVSHRFRLWVTFWHLRTELCSLVGALDSSQSITLVERAKKIVIKSVI